MKLYVFLTIALTLLVAVTAKPTCPEEDGCLEVKKVRAIWPYPDSPSNDLNEFNWKIMFMYKDGLVFYQTPE
jgi:hypothetical protein